jgi:hypothetical protein
MVILGAIASPENIHYNTGKKKSQGKRALWRFGQKYIDFVDPNGIS